jgi:hypothetical protein
VDVRAACLSTSCAEATCTTVTCEIAVWAAFSRRGLQSDGIRSRGRHESRWAPAGFALESETRAEWEAARGLGPFGLVHSLPRVCVKSRGLRPLWLDSPHPRRMAQAAWGPTAFPQMSPGGSLSSSTWALLRRRPDLRVL